MEEISGQEHANSFDPSAILSDCPIHESPRQSISDVGRSDDGAMAEKEECDDVVPDHPLKISTQSPTRNLSLRHQRQDSWKSEQLSPVGTVYDLSTNKPINIDMNFGYTSAQSFADETTHIPIRDPIIAAPGQVTNPQQKTMTPCFPSQRDRYETRIHIPSNEKTWKFPPLETFTIHDIHCDKRWSSNTHPEGQLYFASPRRDGQRTYLTEEHLYEPRKVEAVEIFIAEFEKRANGFSDLLTMKMDIFVSFIKDGEEGWFYYCVDTSRRCLFWVDEVDLTWMADNVGSVPSKGHLKYGIDYEYWLHVEHFPFHHKIPDSLIHDIMGVAIHSFVDSMTSLDSTFPFSKEDTRELVDLVKHLHTLKKTIKSHGYIVVAAARLMTIFVNERFYHFAGQEGARLTRDQSIRGNISKRTFLIRLLSPMLFYAPETHLTSLEKLFVDKVVKAHPWKTFVSKLEEDWIQYVLYSTVLLTADVSFLAVPNVMPNNGIPKGQSAPPAVVATQLSLIAAIGSIVIGLLLVREYKKKASESAGTAADFLSRRSHRSRGLEAMAILYSLPFALLMWGLVSFLAGLGIICFAFSINGLLPTVLYAMVWAFVSLMLIFTILSQLEARLGMSWRQFTAPEFLLRWRKKAKREGENEEIEDPSVFTTANSIMMRSRGTRTRPSLSLFMQRERNGHRDTEMHDLNSSI
ncbi:hypothetical protein SCHPADRAFT_554109 [Schizopora paradoxa]|uniref:WW domain-containing protein n=1 Tax=Schizopora paradoxa TaxID=27342 RepID=A0A0H2RJP6_9AGAM|nr:hypothetical protein SCHPADRAFT_554109 [Schizopora paradoxa]